MNRIALIVSVSVFALGSVFLIRYKRALESEVSGGQRVTVLTVTRAVVPGTVLQESDLGVLELPEAYALGRNVLLNDSKQVLGVRVTNALSAGQSLLWTDLHVARNGQSLASTIQTGKRAITVAGEHDSIHSMVRAGDRVDLLLTTSKDTGMVSFPLLQNILVLAVGGDTGQGADVETTESQTKRLGQQATTFSVTPREAQLVAVALSKGTITPILRNPGDLDMSEKPPEVTSNDVLKVEHRAKIQGSRFSINLPAQGEKIEQVQ